MYECMSSKHPIVISTWLPGQAHNMIGTKHLELNEDPAMLPESCDIAQRRIDLFPTV